jgi:hypothetical protein
MAWIFSAESEESLLPSRPGCVLSPIVKKIGTLKPFSCHECKRGILHTLRSGTWWKLCPHTICQKSTSFTVGSPARTSALQELERAWREADPDSFTNYSALLASAAPDSSSWKTYQLSLFEGLTEYSWDSMRWGMMRDGQLSQPQRWVPRTCESDGSFLPTPMANEGGTNNNGTRDGVNEYKTKGSPSLGYMAKHGLWPTPRASDGDKGGPNQSLHGEPSLVSKAVNWPTPRARDWKDGLTPSPHGRHSASVAVSVAEHGHKGYLNPQFVEVLMGYPVGWTALEGWAMQWFQPKREKRSKG